MTYEEIVAEVATSTGCSKQMVNKTYRAYWKAVKEYIVALPLKEINSEEEFLELRPNVNIPSLGKFYVSLGRYKKLKKDYNRINR